MIDFFDKIYTKIIDKNKFLAKIKFYSFQRLVIRLLANTLLPAYYFFTKNNPKATLKENEGSEKRIIVSLTTFPKRINRVWIVIESILRQTNKPDKIILWLSSEQFGSINELPKILLNQQKRGLEIRFCKDYKSHKKYYFALKQYPNDFLITIDDDIIYPTFIIADLLRLYDQYPTSICCHRGLLIKTNKNNLSPYTEWDEVGNDIGPSYQLFQTSGGGTMFPPYSLHKEVFNNEVFEKICFYADDIWLNIMSRLNNVTIATTNFHSAYIPVINLKNQKLSSINVDQLKNDKQLEDVRNYYIEKLGIDAFKELF